MLGQCFCAGAVNIWYRATDIDRKDIRIKATKQRDILGAFLATIHLQEWMRKDNFGKFLNDWGRSLAKYGYPFGPEDWIFHTTIGVVQNDAVKKLNNALKILDEPEEWTVDKVNLHHDQGDGNYKLVASYPLGKR